MAPSGMFPTPGFTPGNYPPRPRGDKVRYDCAVKKTGKKGCCEFVRLSPESIRAGRIPRCKCGVAMTPAKEATKPQKD